MSLLKTVDEDENSLLVKAVKSTSKHEVKWMPLKKFKKDIYRAIDQDDDDSFISQESELIRKQSDLSELVDIDIYDLEDFSNKSNAHNPKPTSNVLNECTNVSVMNKTMHSFNRETNKPENVTINPIDRLIEAIESLRYSILDNTQIQSRAQHRGKVRRRMSTYGNKGQNRAESHCILGNENLKQRKDKVAVELRIVFLKIGEIDTLKELYHADAFIQAKWREPKLDGKTNEELVLMDMDKYWSPLLYIDNILSETKEAQWLTAVSNDNFEVTIIERRRIKGVFLETLELNDFPLDVQDLTITMTTERPDSEIDLIPDQTEMSAINVQTFIDQQEWKLHEHVEITKRIILQEFSSSMKSHPCLSVTCRAARRPGYFYWNVFLIMFMISGLSFATFAVSPEKAEYRLRLSFTLVLTSVTFKYVITQSLPKISYLTYMDKYVLMSLAILCIVSIWHACVTLLPLTSNDALKKALNSTSHFRSPNFSFSKEFKNRLEERSPFMKSVFNTFNTIDNVKENAENLDESNDELLDETGEKVLNSKEIELLKKIESHVLISFGALYIIAHCVFIFWLYFDASKRRRLMRQKDRDYRKIKDIKMKPNFSK